jgi:hypothetical protein
MTMFRTRRSRRSARAPQPPAVILQYNHDLDVSEKFLAVYSPIRDLLRDERLLAAFKTFDIHALKYKRAFHRLGLWALILGLVPLVLAAIRMMAGEPLFGAVGDVGLVAELCGLLSICVLLWMRGRRYRLRWCHAVFCRERLRQWHFQRFLDGQLVERLATGEAAARDELERRWVKLQESLRDGYGVMIEFLKGDSHARDLFHPATEYANGALADSVFDALSTVRFEHQIAYSRPKIDPEGEAKGLALEERARLSETVASVSLAGAITMSALAFLVSGAHMLDSDAWLPWDHLSVTRCLGGAALLLSVLSAGSRAYRAGFTLPDEAESYGEYCDRIRESQAILRSASHPLKLRELQRFESEAAAELRRFLRMKTRATFIL